MSFNVTNNRLFKKYTKIWGKISTLLNKKFDSDTVYGDYAKYIKTNIKQYKDKINTNFQGKKMPKENELYKCLSLIMLESVIKTSKKHYPQTFLEECNYEIKKNNKMENLIDGDFGPSLELGEPNEKPNEEPND